MKKLLLFLLLIPFIVNSAPTFCCGAECGILHSTAHAGSTFGTDASVSTTFKRTGERAFRILGSGATQSWLDINATSTSTANWVVRCYIYFNVLPTTDFNLINAAASVVFEVDDSKIYAAVNSTRSSTGITVTTGQWYRVELRSSATTVNVYVDGTMTTSAGANGNTATNIRLGSVGSALTCDIFYDDFKVSNTFADAPFGAGHIDVFYPTSDGTHVGLTANDFERTLTGTDILVGTTTAYQLVDDLPLESGSSVDWISMLVPATTSDYVEVALGPATGYSFTVAPRAVDVIFAFHQAGTGAGNMEVRLIYGGGGFNTALSRNAVAGVTTVNYVRKHYADASGTAWAISGGGQGDFSVLKFRFGPTSSIDANPDQYLDGIMIEAEFDDISLTVPGTPSDKRHTTLGVGMAFNNLKIKTNEDENFNPLFIRHYDVDAVLQRKKAANNYIDSKR